MRQALQSYMSFTNEEDSFDKVMFQMIYSLRLFISEN
jgi:hypothetical protein